MPAAAPVTPAPRTPSDSRGAKASPITATPARTMGQREPAPPGQGADQSRSARDADAEPGEDRGEQDAESRLAAAQGPGVEVGGADHHTGTGERAQHTDHDASDQPGTDDEPASRPAGHAWPAGRVRSAPPRRPSAGSAGRAL